MAPDSGPEPTLPDPPKRSSRVVSVIAALLLVAAPAFALELGGGKSGKYTQYVYSFSEPALACPAGYTCTPWTPAGGSIWQRSVALIQDGVDGFPTGVREGGPFVPSVQPMYGEQVDSTYSMPITLMFCYDNAEDCGRFAQAYCSNRGGVQLQVYSAGAQVPCQATCANGEGATCQEPPPNTAKPKPSPLPPPQTAIDGQK